MVTDKNSPKLKIGIFSDVQGYACKYDFGMANLDKALQMLAGKQPDVLMMAGDLADDASDNVFTMYNDLCRKYFDKLPVNFACAGNHDYWTSEPMGVRDAEAIYNNFCKKMEQPAENPLHSIINGYDFISMSEDCNSYSSEMVGKLEEEIRKAVARDNKKPVFVVTHYPPANTVCGSYRKYGNAELDAMFKKYPQVVSFSGHTHHPLVDERSIWQKEYTAISTSTLCYCCMVEDNYNTVNTIAPFAREVINMLYMEVFDDRMEIHRYDVLSGKEIKPDDVWSVPLPFEPSSAPYSFERRAALRKAPEFPADAEMLLRFDYGFIYLIFDNAGHDDFVHYYRVKISENGKVLFDERYVSDFYRMACHREDKRQYFRLPNELIEPRHNYRFEVTPEESFGNAGKPLVLDALIPTRYRFRGKVELFPQE